MKTALITLLLIVCCFAAGTIAEPRLAATPLYKRHEGKPIEVLLGDSRRLFANQAFAKADAYFHSGMYPTIFDTRAPGKSSHLGAASGASQKDEHHEAGFLGEPKDIIDRFSRSFFPSEHKHLDEHSAADCDDPSHHHEKEGEHEHESEKAEGSSQISEILPWLQLTAELDPNKVENYVVGSYWLRNRLGKVKEAEEFLRLGLRNNPKSYEILFELGRIYQENHHDLDRARNLLQAALTRWQEQNNDVKERDNFLLSQIAWHLSITEAESGHWPEAIGAMQIVKSVSPNPAAVDARLAELRQGVIPNPETAAHTR
jgi:tetratricopeptide (TPR) repeat protein